jgi:lipid-A-disaccharide synthase
LTDLLVVAVEASGDRAAAAVIARLAGARVFGLGGAALARAGVDLVASISPGAGVAGTPARNAMRAWRAVIVASRKRRPRAALLVDDTEQSLRLALRLHDAGVRVLWYGAPRMRAWHARRVEALNRCVDRMAVTLPFEAPIWRAAGVDAHYVGHPALECVSLERETARRALGLTPFAAAVAVLPGRGLREVRRLLVPMLGAYERVRFERASVDARVLLAPGLDEYTRNWIRETASAHRVSAFDVDPQAGEMQVLRAFDVALCAPGAVTLEATLARAVPVVTHRAGIGVGLIARLFVLTHDVALPNVLLGRRAFAELRHRDARADRIADALRDAIDRRPELLIACDEVESALGGMRSPSLTVARILDSWLDASLRPAP